VLVLVESSLSHTVLSLTTSLTSIDGTGKSAHDINWLFQAVIERKAIPQDLMDKITCPVLILRGSEDSMVSPEKATEEWRR
jgi:dipeptidyl aminopeptidase/acylaminoacyl peptidase